MSTTTKKNRSFHHVRASALFWQTPPRIDRANYQIHDAVSMMANVESLGWNMWTDDKTLAQAARLSNAHRGGQGVQGRFGHPGMSENSAGKKFMLSKNFRVENGALVHDIQFMKPAAGSPAFAGQDPAAYVMDMAEQYPEEIAESYVMDVDLVWTFADGTEQPYDGYFPPESIDSPGYEQPEGALTQYPVMRPVSIVYLDMVNEGALTHNGLFSTEQARKFFEGSSSVFAAEMFDFVDDWRRQYGIPLDEVPVKVQTIVGQYLNSRGAKEGITMAKVKVNQQPAARGGRGNRTLARFDNGGAPQQDAAPASDEIETGDDSEDESEEIEDANAIDLNALEDESGSDAEVAEEAAEVEQPTDESQEVPQSVAELRADHVQMRQEMNQMQRIMLNQQRTIKAQQLQIEKLAGEPVFTTQLGTKRAGGATGLRQQPPPPRPTLVNQTPGIVNKRSTSQSPVQQVDFDTDPEAATLQEMIGRHNGGVLKQG